MEPSLEERSHQQPFDPPRKKWITSTAQKRSLPKNRAKISTVRRLHRDNIHPDHNPLSSSPPPPPLLHKNIKTRIGTVRPPPGLRCPTAPVCALFVLVLHRRGNCLQFRLYTPVRSFCPLPFTSMLLDPPLLPRLASGECSNPTMRVLGLLRPAQPPLSRCPPPHYLAISLSSPDDSTVTTSTPTTTHLDSPTTPP